MTVAALYVDPNGAYANLPGVEVWDEARDARTYAGPWPVVAHPPCARWCQLASVNQARWGAMIGDDGGTFAAALEAVEPVRRRARAPGLLDRVGSLRPTEAGAARLDSESQQAGLLC